MANSLTIIDSRYLWLSGIVDNGILALSWVGMNLNSWVATMPFIKVGFLMRRIIESAHEQTRIVNAVR